MIFLIFLFSFDINILTYLDQTLGFLFVPGKRLSVKLCSNSFQWNLYIYVAVLVFTILLAGYISLILLACNNLDSDITVKTPLFIYREEWSGRPPMYVKNVNHPFSVVVIRETTRHFCIETNICCENTFKIQIDHLRNNLSDIAYHFLIGGDGNIYVGRGWGVEGVYSNKTLDIAFHGNFHYDCPYLNMIQATKLLIKQGIMMQYLNKDYDVICQNQSKWFKGTARHLCGEVRTWKHFKNTTQSGS